MQQEADTLPPRLARVVLDVGCSALTLIAISYHVHVDVASLSQ
jgi:hypothetical protein